MKKGVSLGKLWAAAATDAADGIGRAATSGVRMLDYLTQEYEVIAPQRQTESQSRIQCMTEDFDGKRARLTQLRQRITVTDLAAIQGRASTRVLGLVMSSSGIKNDVDAWLDFFRQVDELGGDAVIKARVKHYARGFVTVSGNALAPAMQSKGGGQ